MTDRHRVSTCLWFEKEAKEAVEFYVSLIGNSRITGKTHYGKNGPMPEGTPMTISFKLNGTPYMALNGGPHFSLSEAVSLMVECESQEEIDRLWGAFLTDGGTEQQCGWLKDRFGLSWQIVPAKLAEMLQDPDQDKQDRVMGALLKMVKLDIETLEAAYRGKEKE